MLVTKGSEKNWERRELLVITDLHQHWRVSEGISLERVHFMHCSVITSLVLTSHIKCF